MTNDLRLSDLPDERSDVQELHALFHWLVRCFYIISDQDYLQLDPVMVDQYMGKFQVILFIP